MGRKRKGIVMLNEHMLFAEEVLTTYERAELYDAIRAYSMEGVYPDLDSKRPEWRGIFRILSGAQDDVIRKYDETCERNRINALKRSMKVAASRSQTKQEETKQEETIQNETKQNETKQEKTKQNNDSVDYADLKGREVKGVPGVVWA